MEFKKFIRCPLCDGKIVIPKAEERRIGARGGITLNNDRTPRCLKCGQLYNASISMKEFLEIQLKVL